MNDKTRTGLEILQAAVLLGITGDMLLREVPWGLNIFLWIGLLVAALTAITFRRKTEKFTPQTIALHAALLFFALMFVWRDSEELNVFSFLAILTILSVLVLPVLKINLQKAGIVHYIFAGIYTGLNAAFAPFFLLFDDIKWKSVQKQGWSKHFISAIRGLAIAMPILFIFGALFMAADAVFESMIQNTFNVVPESVISHSVLIGFLTWIVAGYLRAAMFDFSVTPFDFSTSLDADAKSESKDLLGLRQQVPSVTEHISEDAVKEKVFDEKEIDKEKSKTAEDSQVESKDQKPKTKDQTEKQWNWREFDNSILPKTFTLGLVETSVILGLINLLFLAFVIIQIPYLFGGMDLVQSTPDFKLAEYARRGFGELVAVSALVLPILLLSHWLLRKDKPINEKIYRVLAGMNIGLLFVIMISATQRFLLYTGNVGYGLTTDRFYPMAFMVFLALVFVWFAMTVLRGMRQQFAWGTLWLGLFVLGTLHVMNPDDFIVRTNIRLMQQGRTYDADYNANLSNDAIPAIMESYNKTFLKIQEYQVCNYKNRLHNRLTELNQQNDFRSWNLSRWSTRNLLEKHKEKFSDYQQCWDKQREKQEKEFPANN